MASTAAKCPSAASGYRATINSYQFGDALAIARIAELAGKADVARDYRAKAAAIKRLVQGKLWDKRRGVLRSPAARREFEAGGCSRRTRLHALVLQYGRPAIRRGVETGHGPAGLLAPFGLTTAEQRHPRFAISYQGHECQWNGPSWPYATAVTLTGHGEST